MNRALRQPLAALPGLPDLLAHRVAAAAELVEGKGAQLGGVDLAVLAERGVPCESLVIA